MFTNIISAFLLLVFGVSYLYKLYVLKLKNRINANVLGRGDKQSETKHIEVALKITTLVWLFLWIFNIAFYSNGIGLKLKHMYEGNTELLGILITAIGVAFFVSAIYYMKSSWRVGIDKNSKTELVTDGIYKYSRNPAFIGFDMMFIGLFLTYPNFFTFIVMCANIIMIHLQILQEEKYLKNSFGEEYNAYLGETSRYLFF